MQWWLSVCLLYDTIDFSVFTCNFTGLVSYLCGPMEFYELEIKNVIEETSDCISVSFVVPEELKPRYDYIPGQYLTLEAEIDGDLVRRSYSICSHKNEHIRVAIKQIEQGVFSNWARATLKPGDRMRVAQPQGNFTRDTGSDNKGVYVAFAAGSGITPVLSILKSVLIDEAESQFILFYGNRTNQDIIFKEELEGLKNRFIDRLQLYHILSREERASELLSGRINPDNCASYFKYFINSDQVDEVFLCGPYEMITGMKQALLDQGLDKKQIKFELFFNPEAEHGYESDRPRVEKDRERTIRVTVDGLTSDISSALDIPILDMAIDAGMDMPYSCKGGVCATCKARVMEGDVEMTTNFALEDDEVDEGYVLTCQTHVKSDYVHVNFDVT